jgi:hypothetical protein
LGACARTFLCPWTCSIGPYAVPDGCDSLVEPRRAVDDEELGPSHAALDEIV